MSKNTISIIIPLYNASAFLSRCLDSILTQSYSDYEVILVDDGSSDGSGAICDDYSRSYSQIKVLHISNSGPSHARNVGIENALGEWMTFVDVDDVLLPDALKSYSSFFELQNVDIIKAGYNRVMSSGYTVPISDTREVLYSKPEFFIKSFRSRYSGFLWNSCIRSDLAKRVKMREDLSWCEDHLYIYDCMLNARGVAFCPNIIYDYSMDDVSLIGQGLSLSVKKKDWRMMLKASLKVKNRMELLSESNEAALDVAGQRFNYMIQQVVFYRLSSGNVLRAKSDIDRFVSLGNRTWLSLIFSYNKLKIKYIISNFVHRRVDHESHK